MQIIITGHKSPDLDTIASAVVYKEYLEKTGRYTDSTLVAVCPEKPNEETVFVFNKFGIEIPPVIEDLTIEEEDKFILVDHNEESQRPAQVANEKVVEVVDHHKVNINFSAPIKIDTRTLGSTCTILYEIFNADQIELSLQAKGLILASILSDTVGLMSVLATDTDKNTASELAKALKVDLKDFTHEIFGAKSSIDGMTDEEIVMKDYKVFDFGGKKTFIGILETVNQGQVLDRVGDFVAALGKVKTRLGAEYGFFIVQDILNINSKVVCETEEETQIVEQAFSQTISTTPSSEKGGELGFIDIGALLSRKKEIAPAIEKVLTQKT